jgi:hypothetical protein
MQGLRTRYALCTVHCRYEMHADTAVCGILVRKPYCADQKCNISLYSNYVIMCAPGSPRASSGPGEIFFFRLPSKGTGPAKNIHTKSDRLILICRVTWAWSDRVNL